MSYNTLHVLLISCRYSIAMYIPYRHVALQNRMVQSRLVHPMKTKEILKCLNHKAEHEICNRNKPSPLHNHMIQLHHGDLYAPINMVKYLTIEYGGYRGFGGQSL